MPQVKLSDKFFGAALRDYANWKFAWFREAGQNSLDAGSTAIDVRIYNDESGTHLIWKDNGCGMSRDTIENKFLTLGESGKDSCGSVGGFGVAKQLLAFAHRMYTIKTGDLLVTGTHGDYMIESGMEPVKGVELHVLVDENVYDMIAQAKKWIENTTTSCIFTINGENVNSAPIRPLGTDIGWCSVYVDDTNSNKHHVQVRINGQLMFIKASTIEKFVSVELHSNSIECLTSNRDGLKYGYDAKLEKLLVGLIIDPTAILDIENPVITMVRGKLGSLSRASKQVKKVDEFNSGWVHTPSILGNRVMVYESDSDEFSAPSIPTITRFEDKMNDDHDIIIYNGLNIEVANEFLPDKFSAYSTRLMKRWCAIISECLDILNMDHEIMPGWAFTKSCTAMHIRKSGIECILINPIKIDNNVITHSVSDFGWGSFCDMVTMVIHELAHIFYHYHDERWASKFTYMTADVFKQSKRINSVYSKT